MRALTSLWAPLAACAALASAQPAPAPGPGGVSAANELYRDGRYAEAASAYQALLESDPGNAALHYDLANARFKEGGAGSLGRAVAGYWRAYRLCPRDADVRHNLDFALRKSGEALIPPGTPHALHFLFHYFSDPELLGLQWIGYWLCLLLGAAYVSGPGVRESLKPWLLAALACWAASVSWWGLRRLADVPEPGVIVLHGAEARSGPGPHFPVSFNAPEGRRVSVLSESGDWLEVGVLQEGMKGWLPSRAVERL